MRESTCSLSSRFERWQLLGALAKLPQTLPLNQQLKKSNKKIKVPDLSSRLLGTSLLLLRAFQLPFHAEVRFRHQQLPKTLLCSSCHARRWR